MLLSSVRALRSVEGAIFLAILVMAVAYARGSVPLARRERSDAAAVELSRHRLRTADVYLLAGLFGGYARIVETAIVALVASGHVEVGMGGRVYAQPTTPPEQPVEAGVWAAMSTSNKGFVANVSLPQEHLQAVAAVLDRLRAEGLVLRDSTTTALRLGALVMALATVVTGAIFLATTEIPHGEWWALVPGVIVLVACTPGRPVLSAEGKRLRDLAALADIPAGVPGEAKGRQAVWMTARRGLSATRKTYSPLDGLTLSGETPPGDLDERSWLDRWSD